MSIIAKNIWSFKTGSGLKAVVSRQWSLGMDFTVHTICVICSRLRKFCLLIQ